MSLDSYRKLFSLSFASVIWMVPTLSPVQSLVKTISLLIFLSPFSSKNLCSLLLSQNMTQCWSCWSWGTTLETNLPLGGFKNVYSIGIPITERFRRQAMDSALTRIRRESRWFLKGRTSETKRIILPHPPDTKPGEHNTSLNKRLHVLLVYRRLCAYS